MTMSSIGFVLVFLIVLFFLLLFDFKYGRTCLTDLPNKSGKAGCSVWYNTANMQEAKPTALKSRCDLVMFVLQLLTGILFLPGPSVTRTEHGKEVAF